MSKGAPDSACRASRPTRIPACFLSHQPPLPRPRQEEGGGEPEGLHVDGEDVPVEGGREDLASDAPGLTVAARGARSQAGEGRGGEGEKGLGEESAGEPGPEDVVLAGLVVVVGAQERLQLLRPAQHHVRMARHPD